jgi:hypothetical protein
MSASPRAHDTIWMNAEQGRQLVLKRLLLFSLDDLYQQFKNENPDVKIGSTKVFMLRPKNCKKLGTEGFHNTCTCEKHENFRLLCEALNKTLKTHLHAKLMELKLEHHHLRNGRRKLQPLRILSNQRSCIHLRNKPDLQLEIKRAPKSSLHIILP